MPLGWDIVTARKPRFVVFGELHGTEQSPAFVGDVACALAARGERILVAVEHSSMENAAFQKAWRLDDAQFPAALKRAGWAERDDGVGSEAMLTLLVRLHRMSRRGGMIDIVAFSGIKDEAQRRRFAHLAGQGPHDAAQAENILMAADARRYDHVLVLVGNSHARKLPVDNAGTRFEPMAMQLGRRATIVTLDMKSAGGTSWNCQLKPGVTPGPGRPIVEADIGCGSYPVSSDADLERAPFMALAGSPGVQANPDYDGIFWVGKVSASPQAVPKR